MASHRHKLEIAVLVVMVLVFWLAVGLFYRKMQAHENLPVHAEIQRQFNIIEDRYQCLEGRPDQTAQDLIDCDEWAKERYPIGN